MRPALATFVLAGLAVTEALTFPQYTDPPVACGRGLSCGNDAICVPDDPTCSDKSRCRGTCAFRNTYPSCGGHTIKPVVCAATADCIDDPRNPESCGMACDFPGMCVPKLQKRCRTGRNDCPKGLWCYRERTPCKGKGCPGICL